EFHTPESGIARGCALSPLMGALHLHAMDAWFAGQMEQAKKNNKPGIYYARYMDDIVILAHTRWQLRRQVRALNQFFNEGGFCQHPDKTFIGRTERGFDWMGAQMSDTGVEGIAHRARTNHLERLRRLYERVRKWPAARRQARMSQYRKRWKIWAGALTCFMQVSGVAHASIGTSAELDKGVRSCITAGTLKNLSATTWGGACVIQLSGQSWAPASLGTPLWYSTDDFYLSLRVSGLTAIPAGNTVQLKLKNNLTATCKDSSNLTSTGTWNAGTTFGPQGNGAGPNVLANSMYGESSGGCVQSSAPMPDNPIDAGATEGGRIVNFNTSTVSAELTWNVNLNVGDTLAYPAINLNFIRKYVTNFMGSIGVAGSGGIKPDPVDPPTAGDPPNCSAISGVNNGPYDFGNGSAGTAAGTMTTDKTVAPHSITLTCTSGANGSVPANATLYVQSNDLKNADNKTLVASATDWLGLRLKLPTTAGGNGKAATGQTLGDYVVWNGAIATPIWNWALAGEANHNANVPTYPLTLTPEIYQLQAAPGTQDGQRTFTVTYSAIIQ
ncbi:TPA: reverse transcriptase domain-containing protein, partial [Enterobacter ludwigii]